MGLFGNNDEKKAAKVDELLNRYGLQELSDERDFDSVTRIAWDLMGNKLIELGVALKGNAADSAKLSYLNAIMEQNFIMIRQLDRISKKLEDLNGKS